MVELTITVICVWDHGRKDHPGTNCPFYTVHTGRLLFGWERTHCLQSQWLFTARCGLSSEESLFQNRLAWCLWLPTPFLSMEPSMDKCLVAHPMQPFPVTSGSVSGLELGLGCRLNCPLTPLPVNLAVSLLKPSFSHIDSHMVDKEGASVSSQNDCFLNIKK